MSLSVLAFVNYCVDSQKKNYQNCCHQVSYFYAKMCQNSISAGALLEELTALSQTP